MEVCFSEALQGAEAGVWIFEVEERRCRCDELVVKRFTPLLHMLLCKLVAFSSCREQRDGLLLPVDRNIRQ